MQIRQQGGCRIYRGGNNNYSKWKLGKQGGRRAYSTGNSGCSNDKKAVWGSVQVQKENKTTQAIPVGENKGRWRRTDANGRNCVACEMDGG